MGLEGISTIQRTNFEYIQEIDGKWYYLDEVLRYSKPYAKYKLARNALLEYFEKYEEENDAKGDKEASRI